MGSKKNNDTIPQYIKNKITDMATMRKQHGITNKQIATAMGYKGERTVYEIERFLHGKNHIYGHYMKVVTSLCESLDREIKPRQIRRRLQLGDKHEDVTPETMKRFLECTKILASSQITKKRIGEEIIIANKPLSNAMVCHFEKGKYLTEARAKAYIAAVEKLCLTHQMAIEKPAPVQPAVTVVEESVAREWTVITPGMEVLKVSADSADDAALEAAKRLGPSAELAIIVHDGGTDFYRFKVRPISTFEVIRDDSI